MFAKKRYIHFLKNIFHLVMSGKPSGFDPNAQKYDLWLLLFCSGLVICFAQHTVIFASP